MSYTDLQTNLCPMGSLTRQPYDESQNPRNIPSLKLTGTVSLGDCSTMSTKWPHWQSRRFRGPEKKKNSPAGHCKDCGYPRSASIPCRWPCTVPNSGVRVSRWEPFSGHNTLLLPCHWKPYPGHGNPQLQWGERYMGHNSAVQPKPSILWHISEMCSSCGTCKYVCV